MSTIYISSHLIFNVSVCVCVYVTYKFYSCPMLGSLEVSIQVGSLPETDVLSSSLNIHVPMDKTEETFKCKEHFFCLKWESQKRFHSSATPPKKSLLSLMLLTFQFLFFLNLELEQKMSHPSVIMASSCLEGC